MENPSQTIQRIDLDDNCDAYFKDPFIPLYAYSFDDTTNYVPGTVGREINGLLDPLPNLLMTYGIPNGFVCFNSNLAYQGKIHIEGAALANGKLYILTGCFNEG